MQRLRAWACATLALVSSISAGGCRKASPPIAWTENADVARDRANREEKLVLVFVHASWDAGSVKLSREVFADPEVRRIVARDFVAVSVDATDDEIPATRRALDRFKVLGTPNIVIFKADLQTELLRLNNYVTAKELAAALEAVPRAR